MLSCTLLPHACYWSPNPYQSVLAETVAKTGMILLAGEITSHAVVDYQKVVRDTIRHIGYDDSSKGIAALNVKGKSATVLLSVLFPVYIIPA